MHTIGNGLLSESFPVKARPGGRTMKVKVVGRLYVISPDPPGREIGHMFSVRHGRTPVGRCGAGVIHRGLRRAGPDGSSPPVNSAG